MISGRASRLALAGLALGAGLVLRPPAARAVGDLPPPNSGSTPDVLILLDSTANQNSALLSLGPTTNYYLGSNGAIKQYHVWQRALTGSVVKPNNTINTPPPNASDPEQCSATARGDRCGEAASRPATSAMASSRTAMISASASLIRSGSGPE